MSELRTGSVIAGRFRVETALGQGSMGEVYRVREEPTGRTLALKRRRDVAAELHVTHATLFEREYHSLAQLAHPRIIAVYDYGLDGDGTPFYTMELLSGEDLLARQQRPWLETCRLLLDVASSLAILHSRRLLHRDLSPRNVRCTSDGRAKLIDFGAMAAMGRASTVVGTPMFIPPEALAQQPLDARSDLYALGVLAYWMLTGRYPYPARCVTALRAAWRTPPKSPRQLVSEVPAALDGLVMELLQLDRRARPASAAEVMERLTATAGALPVEPDAVPQAYLVTPPLIGREPQLQRAREQLLAARCGEVAILILEGRAGTGRSRMLDACVLEAKLCGMAVLRPDPRHPERLRAQLEPWREAARSQPLLIAIDDADAIDARSAALLAEFVEPGERDVALILTRRSDEPDGRGMALLRDGALALELAPLSAEQTELLLRAVFGEVPHVTAVAACLHHRSHGHPRRTLALAERLVARGLAQYEAGGWKLPPAIAPEELPESLSAEWRERIAALTPDARELAEALALCDAALPEHRHAALTEHGDSVRCWRALDLLVAQAVLLPAEHDHRFAQHELAVALREQLTAPRKRALHLRIAAALEQPQHALLAIEHLFHAGETAAAVSRLIELGDADRLGQSQRGLTLLEQALEAAPAIALSERERVRILSWLTISVASLADHARMVRYGLPLLERLERDTGLCDYRELAGVPDHERMPLALARAQARHHECAEHERGPAPVEALHLLARLCTCTVNVGLIAQDSELLERLPSLEPLAALSPAFSAIDQLIRAARDFQAGRLRAAIDVCRAILERIEQPDRAGLDPVHHQNFRFGLLYLQGAFAAGSGYPHASAWITELEREPGHRVNAWRVHMTAALMRGDMDSAQKCQRRAELLALQDGELLRYRGTAARIELVAHAMAADLMGLKRAMEQIERVQALYPGWSSTLALARAYYRKFQGDAQSALQAARDGLRMVAPGRHLDWALLAGCEALILSDLGRHDEAVAAAQRAHATHARERLSGTTTHLLQVLAEVHHAAGHHALALTYAERCVAGYERLGRRGLCLGSGYEVRARIAAVLGDAKAFERDARRCAREYRRGKNSALSAKYARLIDYARCAGIKTTRVEQPAADSGEVDALTCAT